MFFKDAIETLNNVLNLSDIVRTQHVLQHVFCECVNKKSSTERHS